MAVCFDCYCPECDFIRKDCMLDKDEEGNHILPLCPECAKEEKEVSMRKMMGTKSFELKFDNRKDMCDWAGNTSKYWDEIKRTGGEEPSNPKQQKWW